MAQLIEGFESPHGMELLATVHWLAQHDAAVAADVEWAIAQHDPGIDLDSVA